MKDNQNNKKLIEELDKAIYYPQNGPTYGINEGAYEYGVMQHDLLMKRILKVFTDFKERR